MIGFNTDLKTDLKTGTFWNKDLYLKLVVVTTVKKWVSEITNL